MIDKKIKVRGVEGATECEALYGAACAGISIGRLSHNVKANIGDFRRYFGLEETMNEVSRSEWIEDIPERRIGIDIGISVRQFYKALVMNALLQTIPIENLANDSLDMAEMSAFSGRRADELLAEDERHQANLS